MSIVKLTGKISNIEFVKENGKINITVLECNNNNTYDITAHNITYYGFLKIRVNDIIKCEYFNDGDENVILNNPIPIIEMPKNRDSIIMCFIKVLKKGNAICSRLYNCLSSINLGKGDVVETLSYIAETWMKTRDEYLLEYFTSILSVNEIKSLLIWWHNERNLRKLYLIGLDTREINNSKMTCDEIYNTCKTNPYIIHSIPLDKCKYICSYFGLEETEENVTCGKILRFIWKCVEQRKWSCVKKSYLLKQEREYDSLSNIMIEKYGIVECENKVQLKYQNKVENYVSNFIINLRKNDWVEAETPLDTLINGKMRLSANFTKNLSEDQIKAVQGALDHKICVITGGAGTGKCMAKGTKILMYDSTFKNIENIKCGEKIMGPDSKQRIVLSKCNGFDTMYKIIPEKGEPFICNSVHVLTLIDNEGNILDIPLDKYIEMEDKNYKLFHVPLNYEFKEYENLNPFEDGYNYEKGDIQEKYILNDKSIRNSFYLGYIEKLQKTGKLLRYNNEIRINEKLSTSMTFLIRSLGFLVYENNNLTIIENELRVSFKIEKLGSDEYYGFELDGDGRYLLHDLLVTHNTTTIQQITHNLDLRGETYAICSFTGKAVSRVKEITGKNFASTMDRMIANSSNINRLNKECEESGKAGNRFKHVIIDEASMVTTELFYRFLKAFPDVDKITLVGDVNQLPPIEWGSLLYEVMKSNRVPIYYLVNNHRYYFSNNGDNIDGIILNANKIMTHSFGNFSFELSDENRIIENFRVHEGRIERVYDVLKDLKNHKIDANDIMILCPYNDELPELNNIFQKIFTNKNNPKSFVIDKKGRRFNIGDRVIHNENDYEIGVFNGTEGYVRSVKDGYLNVFFKNIGTFKFSLNYVEDSYSFTNLPSTTKQFYKGKVIDSVNYGYENDKVVDENRTVQRLDLAFAITVDKSQGSERDYVIYYVPDRGNKLQSSFINKNRTYTAITRSCFCFILIGNLNTVINGINHSPYNRIERLRDLLKNNLDIVKSSVSPSELKQIKELEMMGIDESNIIDFDGYDDEDFF